MAVLRGQYLAGLAICLETMWDLAMEILGKGPAVPYERSVEASTGKPPEPSQPEAKRNRVAELLSRAGYPSQPDAAGSGRRLAARATAPMGSVRALGAAVIAHFDNLSAANLLPHLPNELAHGAARQHRLSAHQGRLVFRLDELPGPRRNADGTPASTKPATRSTLRCKSASRNFSNW